MPTLRILDRPEWLPAAAWPWPTRALDFGAGHVAVTDTGAGPTFLFVHVGAWSFVWRDVLLRMQDTARCITVDAPGCGLSARLTEPPTLALAADAVTAVIDAMDLCDLVLVAHDLGGPAGFAAASRRADRVTALAAINCFAWPPRGPLFRGMLAVMGSAPVSATDGALGWLPAATSTRYGVGRHWRRADRAVFRAGVDQTARRAWHGYFRDALHSDVYVDVEAGLNGLLADRPLLTIFGSRNDPLRFQPRWKALFPGAVQLKVPRGNHFPMCDDPGLVAGALGDTKR